MSIRKNWIHRILVALALVSGAMLLGTALQGAGDPPAAKPEQGVFTPGHPSALSAFLDFLDFHKKTPAQPIAFTHQVHIAKGIKCEACHMGVADGPDAVIPSVKFCMTCHSVIDVDNPEIKKVAAYKARGEDIPWQRVYNYSESAHVKFNHAPHIRAGVDCSSCHGDLSKQTVAQRAVDVNMGYCVTCHRQRSAPTDCLTCHI